MQNPPPPAPPPGGLSPQYPAPLAPPGSGYPAPVYPAASTMYAGFWIRLVARIVDGVIVAIPVGVVFFVFIAIAGGIASTANSSDQNAQAALGLGIVGVWLLVVLLATVGTIVYYVYFWGTSGSTLGMRLFRLRLVDANTGGPIGIGRAVIRYLMTFVNTMACYIGWIWVAFDPRKQGWHDHVANSVVIQG